MATYRILSLDGGGIRGLMTAVILERLETAVPGWLRKVDLFAGTSTGGIIALGLAKGLTPTDARNLYYNKGTKIFFDTLWDDVKDLGRLIGAEYDNKNLKEELTAVYGNTRLKQLPKRVLIPAFDLDNEDLDPTKRSWKAKFFHNFPGNDSDGEMKMVDVALYTSAAPTYFPTADGFIDGGVAANNPSMAAVAQTQDSRAKIDPRPSLDELVLLSIGTGNPQHRVEGKRLDWGISQWAAPLVNILLDGTVSIPHFQCEQLLGERYFRLFPVLPPDKNYALDDVSKMDDMITIALDTDISGTVDWLKQHWK